MAAAHQSKLVLQHARDAISTCGTDYLLVAGHDLQRAIGTLERAKHAIYRSENA
jgi:hypothetical protein